MLFRTLIPGFFAACMLVSMPVIAAPPPLNLLGNAAPSSGATRTIVITPDTKWVNVEGGEVINFIVGDRSFAWDFYLGDGISSFELNRVAPPGLLNRPVIAYVSSDPRYRGR